MTTTTIRRALVPSIAAIALAGSLAACGSSSSNNTSTSTGGTSTSTGGSATGGSVSGKLSAGGSSAQGTAQTQWITDFQKSNSGATVTYNPVGSGDGVTSFTSGAYPFAGSDAFLDSDQYGPAKKHCGGDPIEVPDYIDPVAVVFNLKGISSLNLDGKTIAEIFSGKITKWNDPAIAAQNKGVSLPNENIEPVHRSDDSGTTFNFTDYLHQAGQGAWPQAANETWPTTKGLNGDGTSGVVTTAKGADGSIAYIDASQAGGFGVVKVKVGSQYVMPSATGAANDLAVSKVDKTAKSDQMIYDINRTTTDPKDYPILLVSYLITCQKQKSAAQASLVKSYLSYVVSPQGQASAHTAAASAPLPAALSTKAAKILSTIS